MVAISACLTGVKCRYNGTSSFNSELMEKAFDSFFAVCPEVLAGLETPRVPCEIFGGSGEDVLFGTAKVVTKDGEDLTEKFIAGSKKALDLCVQKGVQKAYLQAKSPSCGCGKIYDGSFQGNVVYGNGVFVALLLQAGIEVVEV